MDGMEWSGGDGGVDGMEVEWNGGGGWMEMDGDGVEWMEWSGVEWNGVEWSGVEWMMEWNGWMEWNGVEWNGMEWMDGWMDGMDDGGGWSE